MAADGVLELGGSPVLFHVHPGGRAAREATGCDAALVDPMERVRAASYRTTAKMAATLATVFFIASGIASWTWVALA